MIHHIESEIPQRLDRLWKMRLISAKFATVPKKNKIWIPIILLEESPLGIVTRTAETLKEEGGENEPSAALTYRRRGSSSSEDEDYGSEDSTGANKRDVSLKESERSPEQAHEKEVAS